MSQSVPLLPLMKIPVFFDHVMQAKVASVSPSAHKPLAAVESWTAPFSGLMVTALALKAEGLTQRVGILDCDMHYGDGTENIIQALGIDFVRHYTAAADYHLVSQAAESLASVPERLGASGVKKVLR